MSSLSLWMFAAALSLLLLTGLRVCALPLLAQSGALRSQPPLAWLLHGGWWVWPQVASTRSKRLPLAGFVEPARRPAGPKVGQRAVFVRVRCSRDDFLVVSLVMPPVLMVVPDAAWMAAWMAAFRLLVFHLGFLLPPFGCALVMSRRLLPHGVVPQACKRWPERRGCSCCRKCV